MNQQQQIAMVQQMRQHSSGNDQGLQPSVTYDVTVKEYMIPTFAGETRALVYVPNRKQTDIVTWPVFFNMHGGGFVLGQADGDDSWCRLIADRGACLVVNIDYKLAPEHKFPTAVYECYDVVKWMQTHADEFSANASMFAIGGHSAGGNLAAAVCLLNRERGNEFPILLQIIDYAVLDLATDPAEKPNFPEAIPADVAKTFNTMYLTKPEDASNPLASPVLADSFSNLPEALIITAERDSLAQEARTYAAKLEADGVKVTHKEYAGAVHGFTHHGDLQMAEDAWYLMSDKLKDIFNQASV